jgi:gamma-glutamylcyclotransferase (GGCT)/AIG2-like uncharacterized protein YtfP
MEYLFVYGLFRDSGKNLLGECTYCGKSFINGKLYRVNEFYPGFVFDKKSKVWGDVYLIDPINLTQMDEYEGDEYIRIKVRTSSDVECWVYQYKYDVSKFEEIKGGDWMLR